MSVLRRASVIAVATGVAVGAMTGPAFAHKDTTAQQVAQVQGPVAPGDARGSRGFRSLTINVSDAVLAPGESAALSAVATRQGGRARDVAATYTSSNAAVATVSGGVLKAVGAGTATITGAAFNLTDTLTVTVRSPASLRVVGLGSDRFGTSSSFGLVGAGFTPGSTVTARVSSPVIELRGFPVTANADGSFAGFNPSNTGAPMLSGPGFFTSKDQYSGTGTCTARLPLLITATDAAGISASTTFVC